jgi:hypothetical protein
MLAGFRLSLFQNAEAVPHRIVPLGIDRWLLSKPRMR